MGIIHRSTITASILVLWFTAGPVVVGSYTSWWVVSNGISGLPSVPIMVAGVVVLLGFALLPTTLVAILAGYVSGMSGIFFTVATYLPAATLGFWVAGKFRPQALEAWLQRRPGYAATLQRLQAGGWQTVFWIRLSPALPFGISNLVMAWAGLPLRSVLVGSLPGMLPRTLIATYLGMQAQTLQEALRGGVGWGQLTLSIVLLVTATLGLYIQGNVRKA